MYVIFSNAFIFLTMPVSRPVLSIIYKRLGNGSDVSYGGYLSWINLALAKKFK